MEAIGDSSQYWREAELELPTCCAACEGVVLEPFHIGLMDHEEGIPGVWNMLRCKTCHSLSLSPRPTRSAVIKAYRSYYTHLSPLTENRAYEGTSLAWRLVGGYLRRRFGIKKGISLYIGSLVVWIIFPLRLQLDYLYRHLPRMPGRLLDVGCGNGAFMLRAQDAGWVVEGIEPDSVAASQGCAHGLSIFMGDIAVFQPQERYDVITLAHVIEHLHDPSAMLRACADLIRPGGTIWVATPNIESLGHKLFSAAWQPLEVPRHFVMPSPLALAAMLRDAGFEDIRFVRRGRGSRKRLDASNRRASALGLPTRSTLFWSTLVDLYASCSTLGAEELVVMAHRSTRSS
ncbi:MAG: class I SAM-dependent methyltransferase [Rhodanobacter sp.]